MRQRVLLVVVALAVVIVVGALLLGPEPAVEAPPEVEELASNVPAEPPPAEEPEVAPAPAVTAPRPAPRPTPPPAPVEEPPVVAAPVTGTLRIETDVPGATVFLDRIGVGEAPMTIRDITPGPHRVNVSAPGYDGYGETLDIEPGERVLTVNFKEIRLDARLNVVHKHGLGSCRGALTGTPQGIQFTADDGKDNFTVGFADIETFEVDYLAKNLRLKVRQGRTYNFGDPDDDADRLFVFHRDVDKVRERVLTGQ